MGMFGDLMNKIFHHDAAERPAGASVPIAPRATTSSPAAVATAPPVIAAVDIDRVLTSMASTNKEKLDWKHSIVDLMKLVGMDSSFTARKTLASELHYTGDTNDSAKMNMWLHKEVMRKLAENGGTLPADLKTH